MNWVTTNIRFPEDVYMDLKMEAAKKRKSVAAVVRDKITRSKKKKSLKGPNVEKIIREMDRVAAEISKHTKGISLSKAVIEMRYEQ